MAVSVNQNQTMRLRDLRDQQVPRGRGEPRAPTRRPKFQDSLRDPKAGEVVGNFPAGYDKQPKKPQPRKNTLSEAATRTRPRQAVAALMAREGISTQTKFTRRSRTDEAFGAGAGGGPEKEKEKDDQPAWMKLLPEAKTEPVRAAPPPPKPKDEEERMLEARMEKLEASRKELQSIDRFQKSIDGYSSLDKHLKGMDKRVLAEAGKIDRNVGGVPKSKEAMNIELMQKQMAMDQQLNLKYLQLQDKLQRGLETLLSNLLKARNETVKNAISNS